VLFEILLWVDRRAGFEHYDIEAAFGKHLGGGTGLPRLSR